MVPEKVAQEYYLRLRSAEDPLWLALTHAQIRFLRVFITDVQEQTLKQYWDYCISMHEAPNLATLDRFRRMQDGTEPLVLRSGEWRHRDDPNAFPLEGGPWIRRVAHPLCGNEKKQNIQYLGAMGPGPCDAYEAQLMLEYLDRIKRKG